MARAKINYLKDMKIHEVSLVTEPACPGAVVLFTKKRDVSDEPRDERGRWTRSAVAAIGHARDATRQAAQQLSEHARRLATAVANHSIVQATRERLGAAASQTVAHTTTAISTTRPRGAYPVTGGGVQFDFEHNLADHSKLLTSVQIRPEHLPGSDGRYVLNPNGVYVLQQHTPWRKALDAVHTVLRRGGYAEQPSFAGQRPGWLAYKRVDPATVAAQEHAARVAAAELKTKQEADMRRAQQLFGSGSGSSYTGSGSGYHSNAPQPAPLSTEVGGIRRSAPGGVPEYSPYTNPPNWAREVYQKNPEGKNKKDEEGYPVPLSGDHTARTAAGWGYYRGSDFIPAGRPDVQEHIEYVHDWLSQSADNRAVKQASMTRGLTPKSSGGRAYFSREGWYVPAGNEEEQRRWLTKYQNESDRIEAAHERGMQAMASKRKPADLFRDERGNQIHEEEPGTRALKQADDDIDRYLSEHGATRLPPDPELGREHTTRWPEADRRPPRVAKRRVPVQLATVRPSVAAAESAL